MHNPAFIERGFRAFGKASVNCPFRRSVFCYAIASEGAHLPLSSKSSLADLPELVGFFSYSREDDQDSHGALSALRTRIQGELRGQLGLSVKNFRLWQDKEAIASGTLWETEIKTAVAELVFFIPIITPTVVESPYCRFELEAFLAREAALGRSDLVFPILYIDVPGLQNSIRRQEDPVLSIIAKRQYEDWREFRYLDINSTEVKKAIGQLCKHIRNALQKDWPSRGVPQTQQQAVALRPAQDESNRQESDIKRREEEERPTTTARREHELADGEHRRRNAEVEQHRAAEPYRRYQTHALPPREGRATGAPLRPFAPRVCLRVGVSGHRLTWTVPAESEVQLRALVDRVLGVIVDTTRQLESDYVACLSEVSIAQSARRQSNAWYNRRDFASRVSRYANPGSDFVVLSDLAEGADRIVAEAGLAAGFMLQALLPLERAEYARDFKAPDSLAAFEGLLGRAFSVFELDGAVDERDHAYEAAGLLMLANIDLLITIWDGKDTAGIGGAAQIVNRAIAYGIPVVWIDPTNPNAMQLARPKDLPPANARPQDAFRSADEAAIAAAVEDIIGLPKQPQTRRSLQQLLAEKERRWNFWPWYPVLLWLFATRAPRLSDFRLPPALAGTQEIWRQYFDRTPSDRAQRPAIETILLPAFSLVDNLAVYYSLVYRGAFVFTSLFAAVAVALPLAGIFAHDARVKGYLVFAELLIIIAILVTWLRGYGEEWHRRWREYRRLAECLRHMRFLALLGREGSIGRARRLDVGEQDWVTWYAWSLRRQLPLPDMAVDAGYLGAIKQIVLSEEIQVHLSYHGVNVDRMTKIDSRMRRTAEVLFGIAAVVCAAFLSVVWFPGLLDAQANRDLILAAFTFLTALLPALGAVLVLMRVQCDFKTFAEQSKRNGERLKAIGDILADEPLSFARLADRMERHRCHDGRRGIADAVPHTVRLFVG